MLVNISKSLFVLFGVILIVFGLFHIVIPRIAKWGKYKTKTNKTFYSSSILNNFVLSIFFIVFGIEFVAISILFYENKPIVMTFQIAGIFLLLIRIVFEIANPLIIPGAKQFRIFTIILMVFLIGSSITFQL